MFDGHPIANIEKWAKERNDKMCLVRIRRTSLNPETAIRTEDVWHEWWPAMFADNVLMGLQSPMTTETYSVVRRREPFTGR